MSFVRDVPDAIVTELVYRHLSSWLAVGCYFDWRAHYATEQRKREGIGRRDRRGRVLTEEGWLIPTGPLNPRVIDVPGTAVMSPAEIAEQGKIDREVNAARADHEAAVLAEDLFVFGRQWEAVTNQTQKTRRRLLHCRGRSEEREAFMARWHAKAAAH